MSETQQARYTSVAIVLHWLIAFGIVGMIGMGWFMGDLPRGDLKRDLFQLHKSLGIAILLLTVARVLWRVMNPPPPEPAMPLWQKAAASGVHLGFYALMILMPLSGWAMVSASPTGAPTILFGLAKWPHLPLLSDLALETKRALHDPIENVHSKLAWVAIALLVLHVGAALKHQIIDRDQLMARMAPGLFGRTSGPAARGRGVLVAFGGAIAALVAGLAIAAVGQGGPASPQASGAAPAPAANVAQSGAPVWTVDPAQSKIGFAWNYAGTVSEGSFREWTASIQFDPAAPADARIRVEIPTKAVSTGTTYYDGTLQEADWLAGARHPVIVYEVNEGVLATGDGAYEATGLLTIKGETFPLRLPFTLKIEGDTATAQGEAILRRQDMKIGSGTPVDASGGSDWIANDIKVTVNVVATRQ